LEIGFGHGRTLSRAATIVSPGFVAGIDVSEDMVHTATRWNRQLIKEGRVEVRCASSLQIPYPTQSFERVYATHTLYFWEAPQRHLREIHRVMKNGARFVLTFGPQEDEETVAKFPVTVYHFYTKDEVQRFLEKARFIAIHMECRRIGSRELVFAIAHREASSI
jgi:ubiquinone/menaquinone biosynthesis C-methylase UbiE